MIEVLQTVHVTWGVSRGETVSDALRAQGCEEQVIALTQTLNIGPLDPDVRPAWFKANWRTDDELSEQQIDMEAPWRAATALGVHPVYWVCRTDPFEHACFLEFASRMAGRPFDIVDETKIIACGLPVRSLGHLRPAEIMAFGLLERRHPFTRIEATTASEDWARLRAKNAPLRIVRDGRLVSAPIAHFDSVLIEQASANEEMLIKLVARSLRHLDTEGQPGQRCSYEFLFARILALGGARALQVTGLGPGLRDYQVRRFGARSAALGTAQ